jgi:hypothetical protein
VKPEQIERVGRKYVEWDQTKVRNLIHRLLRHQAEGEQAGVMLRALGGSKLLNLDPYIRRKPAKKAA